MRRNRTSWSVILVATLASACASTGAVPHPFPRTRGSQPPQGSDGSGLRDSPSSDAQPSQASPDSDDVPGSSRTDGSARSLSFEGAIGSLIVTALSLRGTPYRNGGSDPNGFDCSGFTQYVFARHGVALARDVRDQFHQGQVVDSRELSPGDLVFFRTTDTSVSHVAIVVGRDEFVHAPSSSGVVRVERLSARYWSRRFAGARRVSGT